MVTIAIYRFVTKRLHKSIRHWFTTDNYRMTRELLKAVLKIRSLQVALRLESVFLFTVFLCCSKLFLFYIFFFRSSTEISTRKRKSRVHFSCDVGPGKLRARRLSLRSHHHNFLWMWRSFKKKFYGSCWSVKATKKKFWSSFDASWRRKKDGNNNLRQFWSAVWEVKEKKSSESVLEIAHCYSLKKVALFSQRKHISANAST